MVKHPARVRQDPNYSEPVFCIRFIDFEDAITQAENEQEIYEYAQDALSIALEHYLQNGIEIPKPSEVEGEGIVMVEPYPRLGKLIR